MAGSASNAQARAVREAVRAPQVDAGGQQPAAVPAPAPPRLYQQICDRRDIGLKHRCWILIRSQRRLVHLARRGEARPGTASFRLFDRDQNPVSRRRRGLDRGTPATRHPAFVEFVEHLSGENAAVGVPPGGQLDPRDLGGVVGVRGSDKAKRHGRRAYGVPDPGRPAGRDRRLSRRDSGRGQTADVPKPVWLVGAMPVARRRILVVVALAGRAHVRLPPRRHGTASSTCASTTARSTTGCTTAARSTTLAAEARTASPIRRSPR